MWIKELQEIKNLSTIFDEKLNNGAIDNEVIKFTKEIESNIDIDRKILNPYIDFLKIVNGLEFNGFIIYGIDEYLLENKPNQSINGFIKNNEIWHENEEQKKFIFLGDSSDSWYVYGKTTEKYYELDKPSGQIIEEYNDINLLFDKVLNDALL